MPPKENTLSLEMLDKDGFLLDHLSWDTSIASQLAENEGLMLTDSHWELIHLIRQFYSEFNLSPAMRPLSKYIKLHLGADKSSSIYLLTLFPESPAKRIAKIAGLPRPENCL